MLVWGGDDQVKDTIRAVLDEAQTDDVAELTRLAHERLTDLAIAGQQWAAAALDRAELDGVGKIVAQVQKQDDRSVFRIGHNGAVVSGPTRYSVRKRDGKGRKLRAWQRSLWFEMTWEQAIEFAQALIRQGDKLALRGKTFLAGIHELRESCPTCATPLEACELMGIDPRQFEINMGLV